MFDLKQPALFLFCVLLGNFYICGMEKIVWFLKNLVKIVGLLVVLIWLLCILAIPVASYFSSRSMNKAESTFFEAFFESDR